MRIFEVNDFLNRFNAFLLESFKEDMYRVYPEQKDNMSFKDAITFFNTHKQVKDGIKRMIEKDENIESSGNLADDIKKKFDTGEKFIAAVTNLLGKLNTSTEKGKKKSYGWKKQIGQEYAKIQQAVKAGQEPDIPDTDFWLIPCRTYEELHSVSQKYTGILPILSRDKIESEYGLKVPEEATHYETSKTPEQFLEYMKKETNFFMDPTWCVAKNKRFFNGYELETSENEKPRCYVFISKKYPNVRFCVTLANVDKPVKEILYEEEKIKFATSEFALSEVRDPWQIGGLNVKETGLEMMRLAFGPKIDKVIEDICATKNIKIVPFSELKDGTGIFQGNKNATSISTSFDNLINGSNMFEYSGFKKINCKFPVLEYGYNMFVNCMSLSEFTGSFPKVKNVKGMFAGCARLKKFECENISELVDGENMFTGCTHLEKFDYNLPKLKNSKSMFRYCKSLETFDCDLSSLENSYAMFLGSGIKTFKSNLTELYFAPDMFSCCENLEKFDVALPKLEEGEGMFNCCKNLKSFNSELPKLKYGERMFNGCENLTRFKGNLSSLKRGYGMFSECKLDTESVKNIAETIAKSNGKTITIGVDEIDEEKEKYIKMIEEKGWRVIVH